jgi:hypothetical protein
MEQSPSWKANGQSASQEMPCLLWKPEGSLLCLQESSASPSPCVTFRKKLGSYVEELSPCPTSKLEDLPYQLSEQLLSISGGWQVYRQLENVTRRGDRDPLNVAKQRLFWAAGIRVSSRVVINCGELLVECNA